MDINRENELERWRSWFEGQEQSKSIPRVLDTYHSAEAFKKRAKTLSTNEEFKCMEINDTKTKCLDLTRRVLREATSAQAEWSTRRSTGLRRIPMVLQNFITKFSEFLEVYSGIVEIIKTADNQYGGLAYSTLSLLFVVAVNKAQQESIFESCLATLEDRISTVYRLHNIAPTLKASHLLGNIYANVIQIARSATIYYHRSSIGRVLYGIVRPPRLYLKVKVQDVTNDVKELEAEASITSQERVQRMDAQLDVTQHRSRNSLLWKLRPSFQEISGDFDVRAKYAAALSDANAHPDDVEEFTFARLGYREEYQNWQSSTKSSLLLLRGSTAHTWTNFSWLSPAAIDVVNAFELQECTTLIYWFVNPRAFVSGKESFPASRLFSELLWQLLSSKPEILENPKVYHDLQEQLTSSGWNDRSLDQPFRTIGEVLTHFNKVNIVVDRVDRLGCTPLTFVERWMELMSRVPCLIKAFFLLGDLKSLDTSAVIQYEPVEFQVVTLNQEND